MNIKNKMLAECIGTFWLVLGGCGTAIFAGHAVGFAGVSLAFGLTVVTMAYGVGHISGAHLNPAVSFGIWVNGRMKAPEMLLYWISQVVGAIIATALMYGVAKSANLTIGTFAANGYGDFFAGAANYLQTNLCGAFVIEAMLTFIFLLVILGATDEKANTKFAGVAIGLCLTLIHLISIPLTNTSVNPARSISQAIFSENLLALPQLWLFIVAPLVGATLAGLVYKAYSCTCEKK